MESPRTVKLASGLCNLSCSCLTKGRPINAVRLMRSKAVRCSLQRSVKENVEKILTIRKINRPTKCVDVGQ